MIHPKDKMHTTEVKDVWLYHTVSGVRSKHGIRLSDETDPAFLQLRKDIEAKLPSLKYPFAMEWSEGLYVCIQYGWNEEGTKRFPHFG